MAEQMAQDPNFQAMTQQLAGMGLGGMAPPAAAGGDGAPAAEQPREADATAEDTASSAPPAGMPNINPEQYMKVRFQIVQDAVQSTRPVHCLYMLQASSCYLCFCC